MREILFRGKRIDNGKWVYGDLLSIPTENKANIIEKDPYGINYKVIPETVEQFTGLTDKNGEKIFEGDILKCLTDDFVGTVIYNKNTASFIVEIKDHNLEFYQYHYSLLNKGDITRSLQLQDTIKIENIYNNPELLEVQDD